ncbi:MAG: lipoyl(octanoyl) transferase LipB [Gammaproteobacteria bacterium]
MKLVVRTLGLVDYEPCWHAMQTVTAARTPQADDELWTVEHRPVFTLGRAARREHLLAPGDIPVVPCDRGGQVTYHGPGQLVVYTLLDVRRLGIGPRELVRRIEQGVIDFLAVLGISAQRRAGAPGVYVGGAKIAALGLRIRGAYSYHGLALNVAMDREPFARINPCGYAGLAVTDIAAEGGTSTSPAKLAGAFVPYLCHSLYAGQPPPLHYVKELPLMTAAPGAVATPI